MWLVVSTFHKNLKTEFFFYFYGDIRYGYQNMSMRKVWLTYIINSEVHFVGYLCNSRWNMLMKLEQLQNMIQTCKKWLEQQEMTVSFLDHFECSGK